ncbi:cytochrome P450 4c21-like, partial [Frankliniella occidentalis]|uniref:Cytochrome P450 4c21-like n=1 Tax=Frankliniella occidentalis TaxID=133901 RepID=A0A9C6WSX8_FRAOC
MDVVLVFAVMLVVWRLALALPSYWSSCWRFRRLELAIPGPPSLPLVGNLLDLALVADEGRLRAVLEWWGGRHDQLSRITLGTKLLVLVSDPDHVAVVLKDPRFAEKPAFFYGFLESVSGRGVLTANGRHWKRHRAAMLPAFHHSVVDAYTAVYAEEAAELVAGLRGLRGRGAGTGAKLRDLLTRTLARASVRTILESDVLPEDEPYLEQIVRNVGRCLMDVSVRTLRPWLWPDAVFALSSGGRRIASFN